MNSHKNFKVLNLVDFIFFKSNFLVLHNRRGLISFG